MNVSDWLSALRAHTCTVVGIGISNLPLIRMLARSGIFVSARDCKERDAFGDVVGELETLGVRLILGAHYLDDLNEEIIFRSPGLRPDLPEFSAAVARGAVLTSEMEEFLKLSPATVIGITGSDGKTTTTTVTAKILEEECRKRGSGSVFLGGNIGSPLLPRISEMTSADFAVAELSSFQLQTVTVSPAIAAITNISPNHLNWHTGMDEYIRAKANIFSHPENRRWVTNVENAVTLELSGKSPHPVTLFSSQKHHPSEFPALCGLHAVYEREGMIFLWNGSEEVPILPAEEILLPGRHNLENYMTAIALTEGLVSPESVRQVAGSFRGVPHRLEKVRVVRGVTYYNSSIDSSPTRTAAALHALKEKPIVICGGCDKNIPFAPLAEVLAERAKAVVLTGATAKKIRAALDDCPAVLQSRLPVLEVPEFSDAVLAAERLAKPGDTVLLSPACASFDAFRNFEERGDAFRRLVEMIPE